MATITDLRRLFDLKKLLILFLINLFSDIIAVSQCLDMKKFDDNIAVSQGEYLHSLFDRWFCVDLSLINFAVYISLYALIIFCVMDRIREDNQKFGVFYLTRYTRKRYIAGKLASTAIFTFFICSITVLQSFITHRIMSIVYPPVQYITVMLLSFILAVSVGIFGMAVYTVFKNVNISFLIAIALFTAQSFQLTNNKTGIPTGQNISLHHIYPLVLLAVGIILFIYVTYKNDFMSTKIKE